MTWDSSLGGGQMSSGVGLAFNTWAGAQHPRREISNMDDADQISQRVARLSSGQLDCLLLVDQLLSSKEIAAELKISPHTVDQRIRHALANLGVERRAPSARVHAPPQEPDQPFIILPP